MKGRDQSIETLRGFALVLLLLHHSDHRIGYFSEAFVLVRMPLFTAISGYLYACRPLEGRFVAPFLLGKSRRLLVPMVAMLTVLSVLSFALPEQMRMFYAFKLPESLADLPSFWFFHPMTFWFLQGLFIAFVLIAALEICGVLRSRLGWTVCLAVSLLALWKIDTRAHQYLRWVSVDGAIFLMPFFLIGLGAKRFELEQSPIAIVAGLVGLLGLALVVYAGEESTHKTFLFFEKRIFVDSVYLRRAELHPWAPSKKDLIGILISACSMLALLRWRFTWKPLAIIGTYAYDIYLTHIVFRIAGIAILTELGIRGAFPGLGVLHWVFMLGLSYLVSRGLRKTELLAEFFSVCGARRIVEPRMADPSAPLEALIRLRPRSGASSERVVVLELGAER